MELCYPVLTDLSIYVVWFVVLGLPIIVSNVSDLMDVKGLWTPEAFSKEFGHMKHDLIDCRRNEPLTGYEIKHFWDGFEDHSSKYFR